MPRTNRPSTGASGFARRRSSAVKLCVGLACLLLLGFGAMALFGPAVHVEVTNVGATTLRDVLVKVTGND